MGRASGLRIIKLWMLLSASLLWCMPGFADDTVSMAPTAQGPQLMFYVRKPLGRRGALPAYSLRVDQVSLTAMPLGAAAFGPLRRRELLELRFGPHAPMQIEFGHRLTWDLHGHQFGPTSHCARSGT
jgi:hypothetical protein